MEKINVLIVEDELLIAQDLKANLEDHDFQVIGVYDQGEDALEFVKREIPDLILMDIQLAGQLDGIATAQKVNELYDIPIIYLSDHVDEQTVNRAKNTHPASYLSKPYKSGDILLALELAFLNAYSRKSHSQNENIVESKLLDRVFIRIDNQASKMILYKDIIYLEAGRAYSTIVTDQGKYVLSSNMGKVFEQFESPDFVKVHRSYAVNINRIIGIEGNMLNMGVGDPIQMSPSHRQTLFSRINLIK